MNFTTSIRIARSIWKTISSFLVLALILGFVMVMVGQFLGRETEYSLSVLNGLSFKSRPVREPQVSQIELPANESRRGEQSDQGEAILAKDVAQVSSRCPGIRFSC